MSRLDVLREQKARHGRRVMAVLPVAYPKALLTAFDWLAVEVWGPPGPPRSTEAGRIQSYVCPLARQAFAFLAGGLAPEVDAILVPHTCDSLQGLATVLADFAAVKVPVLTYIHPKGEAAPERERFAAAELEALTAKLAALGGRTLDPERLAWAVALHREIDTLTLQLLSQRARLDMSDAEFYTVLRRGEYLWPEDHLAELKTMAAKAVTAPLKKGLPLLVTGYVPEPKALLDTLEAGGAYIAADDYAAIGRRIPLPQAATDPMAELAAFHRLAPPCPTRAQGIAARLAYLDGLVERSGARAVLIHTVTFCEPELFDVPYIKRHFEAKGLPVLHIQGELETDLSAAMTTRLEAFLEMATAKGGAR